VSAAQLKAWGEATSISINISRGVNTARATSISSNMSRGVSTARSSSESLCYSVTSIASSTREAESDSYSVSSAVESLGRSNEHFDQHEQGRKYSTQQFREPILQCDEHGWKVGPSMSKSQNWRHEGDFYAHSFGYLCAYSKHLQVFFRTVE